MKKGVKAVAINDPLSELTEYIEAKILFFYLRIKM